jgi:hypothetical protein
MKIKISQRKKIILPILLFISLFFNILYLFDIIDIKINLSPSKNQKLQHKTLKKFIDSPIIPIDSIMQIELNDTLKRK